MNHHALMYDLHKRLEDPLIFMAYKRLHTLDVINRARESEVSVLREQIHKMSAETQRLCDHGEYLKDCAARVLGYLPQLEEIIPECILSESVYRTAIYSLQKALAMRPKDTVDAAVDDVTRFLLKESIRIVASR